MIGAVQRVVQSRVQSASDRNIALRERISAAAGDRGRRRRRAGKSDQLDHLPSIQRQFENAGILDNLADARVSCFHQRRIRLNFDLLGHLPDFQNRR